MRPAAPRGRSVGAPLLAAVMILGFAPLQCILIPERDLTGVREPNRPPTVHITGGVLADSIDVGNLIHFRWLGADADGVVRWYEWAVDDTVSEGAWRRTTVADQVVLLQATQAAPNGLATDWHTFHVRAVDDRLARSRIDSRVFNARTIAPTSRLTDPQPVDAARWAPELRLRWRGEDLDAAELNRQPAFYEIKHIVDPGIDPVDEEAVRRFFEEAPNLLIDEDELPESATPEQLEAARCAWRRVAGLETEVWLHGMEIGRRYLFGVRAVDEAGAREQKFRRNENWILLFPRPVRLQVVLHEPALGSWHFDGPVFGEPLQVTVAPGQKLRFRWVVDGSASGTEAGACTYGFDIPDPEDPAEPYRDPDGLGGWIGWAPRRGMRSEVAFTAEQGAAHVFYLKVRDISNRPDSETRCVLEIRVRELALDRKLLIVDDQRRRPLSPWPNAIRAEDPDEDAWRAEVLASVADLLPPGEQLGQISIFPNEAASPAIELPDSLLDVLGQYQTIVWDCATGDDSGLQAVMRESSLSTYVGAGGNLLLLAWGGVVTKVTRNFSERALDYCAPEPGNLEEGECWNELGFLWQHLHLRGPVDKPRGDDRQRDRKSLVRAVAADPSYPDLPLDRARWGIDPRNQDNGRGDHYWECLVPYHQEAGSVPWFERDEALHVLYTSRCNTAVGHDLNDRPIAWSIDPSRGDDPHPDYGRIVCFNFHPYFLDVPATEMAMSRALMGLMVDR